MAVEQPMSWLKIILITLAVGLVGGLTLGILGAALGFNAGSFVPGVGAAEGITFVFLLTRRHKQIAALKSAEPKQS